MPETNAQIILEVAEAIGTHLRECPFLRHALDRTGNLVILRTPSWNHECGILMTHSNGPTNSLF